MIHYKIRKVFEHGNTEDLGLCFEDKKEAIDKLVAMYDSATCKDHGCTGSHEGSRLGEHEANDLLKTYEEGEKLIQLADEIYNFPLTYFAERFVPRVHKDLLSRHERDLHKIQWMFDELRMQIENIMIFIFDKISVRLIQNVKDNEYFLHNNVKYEIYQEITEETANDNF